MKHKNYLQPSKMQYSDLTLRCNRRVPPNCYQAIPVNNDITRSQLLAMSTLPRRFPTPVSSVYGQLATHSAKPIYIPPPQQYMGRTMLLEDHSTAETPLIGSSDNKVRDRLCPSRYANIRFGYREASGTPPSDSRIHA